MKTSRFLAMVMVGLALSFTPALAQRGGGGSRGGGHSSSVSRSSFGGGSSSRSSFSGSSSRSSSFSSSPSRSSSFSSSPSRSSSSSRSSYSSSPSRSSYSSSPSRSSYSSSPSRSSYSNSPSRSVSASRNNGVVSGTPRGTYSGTRGSGVNRGSGVVTRGDRGSAVRGSGPVAPSGPGVVRSGSPTVRSASGRPSGSPAVRNGGYARPGRPGAMPPSHRPIHPAPYFYHPWHGYVVHCHPVFWDPLPLRAWYWPGFWLYCNSYWYDYHVTDVVVVRKYVQDTYHVDMVTYGMSDSVMYAIVRDGGNTYLQVYDSSDHLLAEQKIDRKYCNLVIDAESGGCWISKKGDRDPLLFLWSEGQLYIYEAD